MPFQQLVLKVATVLLLILYVLWKGYNYTYDQQVVVGADEDVSPKRHVRGNRYDGRRKTSYNMLLLCCVIERMRHQPSYKLVVYSRVVSSRSSSECVGKC